MALPHMPRTALATDILGEKHFAYAIGAAVGLHLAALIAWHLVPRPEIVEVPVYALNVKLGDVDTNARELKAVSPEAPNQSEVEMTLAGLVRDAARDGIHTQSVAKTMTEMNKTADEQKMLKHMAQGAHDKNVIKQYVRPSALQGTSSASGSADKEIVSRYEQLISLWIEKFKLYPDEARAQGMEGETIVRLRIDRRGNIRYYVLERSTGFPLLDRAAIDMVRRSNPVPAVPNDYPEGDELEFLIPVTFRLQ